MNGIDNAVVLISYPENTFHNPKARSAFGCTDVSLTTKEILDAYVRRWLVELFFRQSKGKLALDKYQIQSSRWTSLSLAVSFPLSGHFAELYRLDYAHAGQTTKKGVCYSAYAFYPAYVIFYISINFLNMLLHTMHIHL